MQQLHLLDALKTRCYTNELHRIAGSEVLHLLDALKTRCYRRPRAAHCQPSCCICSMHSKLAATNFIRYRPVRGNGLHLLDALKTRCY